MAIVEILFEDLFMNHTEKRMSQPEAMKTDAYVGGVEKVNGHDAWALFKACAAGDMPKVKTLLAKDRRLVNVWFSYQLPVYLAVRVGHAEIVKLLLDQGANPGNDWDSLLLAAREGGHRQVEGVLLRAMSERYVGDSHGLGTQTRTCRCRRDSPQARG